MSALDPEVVCPEKLWVIMKAIAMQEKAEEERRAAEELPPPLPVRKAQRQAQEPRRGRSVCGSR